VSGVSMLVKTDRAQKYCGKVKLTHIDESGAAKAAHTGVAGKRAAEQAGGELEPIRAPTDAQQ